MAVTMAQTRILLDPKALTAHLWGLKRQSPGCADPKLVREGVWVSNTDLHHHPAFEGIVVAAEVFGPMIGFEPDELEVFQMWGVITPPGAGIYAHDHKGKRGAVVSGVCFLTKGASLVVDGEPIAAEPGRLVVFGSDVMHETPGMPIALWAKERVTVAFDLRRKKGAR
jgi:hypothetical protein